MKKQCSRVHKLPFLIQNKQTQIKYFPNVFPNHKFFKNSPKWIDTKKRQIKIK